MVIKANAISDNTISSGYIWLKPRPSTIILRMAGTYQRAGTIFEMTCSGMGIFSIGNIMPDNIITGIMNTMPDTSNAAICVSTMVDTNNPSASASKIYTNEVTTNAVNDPERGNPSAYFEINSMAVKSMHESRKYGIILAITIIPGRIGETSKISIVPVSFSLTIDTDVSIAHISIKISPMMPGTKLYPLLS